ncbi:MAG: hypothetical protein E7521_00820 [Ruminococcaceae bacterium]|nr:hypothetical protein [Oscillospiraceae bacterium]
MEMIKNLALATDTVSTTPDWMVVVMGVGVVFVGLVLIILICKVMGLFFARTAKSNSKPEVTVAPAATNATIENRQEIIAAVTAACAEEMGTDISALRVISFKKI